MDLAAALTTMGTSVHIPGKSDTNSTASVQRELNVITAKSAAAKRPLPTKPLAAAGGVGAGVNARPIDGLLRLAKATRPLISDDVYDWYRHWSWLRYLGIFDVDAGVLGLSPAGLRVRANQRRVMSEEIGVGIGVLVAEQWCRHLGASGSILAVDVDLALHEGRRWIEFHSGRLRVGRRQPDYLMIYPDPSGARTYGFKSVECKGTAAPANVPAQLARASTQLASLSLGGSPPQGIAVDTVSDSAGVRYIAVDPEDDTSRDVVTINDEDIERARRQGKVEQARDGVVSVPAGEFIASSLLLGMGVLADYAGNLAAARELLPPVTLERLGRVERERTFRETEDGVFIGVEQRLPTPTGQMLRVFSGVEVKVDEALATGQVDAVSAAQRRFHEGMGRTVGRSPQTSISQEPGAPVVAVSGDGALLSLEVGFGLN